MAQVLMARRLLHLVAIDRRLGTVTVLCRKMVGTIAVVCASANAGLEPSQAAARAASQSASQSVGQEEGQQAGRKANQEPQQEAQQEEGQKGSGGSISKEPSHTSLWDAFAEQNRLKKEPGEGESATDYAFGIESRIGNQEGRRLIRRPEGFSEDAYQGFKLFFRVFGEEGQSVGNCIVCHVTPDFTDYEPHVTGGAGGLAVETPSLRNLRLERAAADDVAGGGTGAVGADSDGGRHLERVIREKMRLGEAARADQLPGASPELAGIRLQEEDIGKLIAFLRQLVDVGKEHYRYFLIHFDH